MFKGRESEFSSGADIGLESLRPFFFSKANERSYFSSKSDATTRISESVLKAALKMIVN